ncbi:armadillo/beta-catenin-like repeat-containing protein, putative [Eimeria maxima]|uniref:Armadillo/beta-catenin-like repeat-containing protein, putative n=1 Tax=Eimeria maxima TaxID=5804 RepID=U6MFM4_EIMMA|nr:armadillo/beta-catenin-like repeat-containing protein, putative [Eimeria maxima]CDJ61264.1 armadillo/beta-catenin-like repeat-containing protein, putative [Eimeria maxima]
MCTRAPGSNIRRKVQVLGYPIGVRQQRAGLLKVTASFASVLRCRWAALASCSIRTFSSSADMGNQCCAGRDTAYKRRAQESEYGDHLKNMLSFGAVADDVVRFDRAYDNGDIAEFVRLCNSTCEIEKLEDRMHPWAADPETIGALAATQLAIFASREQEPHLKDEIREAGGIEVLVKLLASKELDRRQSAVVALSFLSVDNNQNCIAMYNEGALPPLIQGMKSDIEGMRAACAQTARNIYVLGPKQRRAFLKAGGIAQLVRFLDAPPNAKNLYTQLEAIYHLEDFIAEEGGDDVPEFVQAVKSAGAVQKLMKLRDHQDKDVADAAGLLLVRLAD